jgi:hypothetical protein
MRGPCKTPDQANGLYWPLCLGPDAHPELRTLTDTAVKILTSEPENWYTLNTAGCLLYRAGRDAEALNVLEASMKASPGGVGGPFDWVFLAMVHHRLGRTEEAEKWLDKAKSYLVDSSRGEAGAGGGPLWRITLDSLIREAEAKSEKE